MQDLIAALVSFFLVQPLQAELTEKLVTAQASRAAIAEVAACTKAAVPVAVERAVGDPRWAMSSALRLWLGQAAPEALLVEIAPDCAAAVQRAGGLRRE